MLIVKFQALFSLCLVSTYALVNEILERDHANADTTGQQTIILKRQGGHEDFKVSGIGGELGNFPFVCYESSRGSFL